MYLLSILLLILVFNRNSLRNFVGNAPFDIIKDDIIDNNSKYREELVEIDMYNIRYLFSKNEIICNLVKQNIQDERLILELNSKFITMDNSVISFIISDDMIDLFTKELGYDIIYKSYVIVKES